MRIRSCFLALVSVLAVGVSSFAQPVNGHGEPEPVGPLTYDPPFVDVSAYLTEEDDINAWYTLVYNLKQNFDYICGDTFCEGEYTNIESLRYRCSVERTTGIIGTCVWVFAASNEEISPWTGKIIADVPAWQCRSPLVWGTSIHDLLSALSGTSPLYAELPGTDQSLYDGLATCL
ncbi:MAG: hypothetical protein GEU99_07915 [Luteitalea sp.]|nr:hypothetical protein [Luteitalea sp.]